jgi:membrane fusion protein (multidrug efflux system)
MRGRQSVIALLGLFLIACSDGASQVPAGRPGAGGPEVVAVITQPVAERSLQIDVEAVGTAHANESVSVTSKAANTVTAIRFKEGQVVQRGAVLVEFDAAQAQAELAAAQATRIESRANYDRSRALANTQVLSASQMDQIEATLKANEARVAAAQARLNDTVIRAPFKGRTGLRRVSVGSLVNPGTMITTLDDTSLIKIEFTVPQVYQHALREGLGVSAQASGIPGRTFEGKVLTVDSRVDPVTRAISVLAGIANEDGILKPGTFMSVRMHSTPTAALLVPEAAIVPEQGRMFAFVVENGVALKREITIGRRRAGEVEIASGLQQGQRVIVEGAMKVRHEARVREASAAAPRPSS